MKSSKIVVLCSGGLDSSVILRLCKRDQIEPIPLFIDYGQRAKRREWNSCRIQCKRARTLKPVYADISGFGSLIKSGLTTSRLRVREDAFLPGRNHLFLLLAASYALQNSIKSVAIGLLNPERHLFPDQTPDFIDATEALIEKSLGTRIKIVAPLIHMNKAQVEDLAKRLRISGTYSCHTGQQKPCGQCISCLEVSANNKP